MIKKWVISIVVCWCAVLHLSGLDPAKALTQYIIDGWTVDNGLPQSSVLSVLQTADGYIWVGTQDGLARFDGVNFSVFNEDNTPGMTKNYIFCLFEDSRDNLWIGTLGGGLLLYKNGEFKRFTGAQGLSKDYIHCIYEDSGGNIWVGTEGGGLNRWDETTGTITVFNTGSGLPHDVVRAVCGDDDDILWVGTENGLCRYKDKEFKPILKGIVPGTAEEVINVFYKDSRDNLWIGTDHGLYLARDGRLVDHQIKTAFPTIDVKHIYEDRENTLWIATENSGLIRYCNGKASILNKENGLLANMVFGMTEDKEGSLWLGTCYGLNRLRDGKFTTMTTREGLSNDVIYSIFQDSKGYLWIGTEAGLNRCKEGKIKYFTAADGLSHTSVAVIYEDSKGFIWVGTDGGLDRLKNSPDKISKVNSYLKGEYIPAVMETNPGEIWVGTLSGLVIIKEGNVQRMSGGSGSVSETVSFIYKDSRGNIWLSRLRKGISRFTAGKFATFNTTHGLAGDSVYCMYEDADSVYWFGTDSGLSCLKDGKFYTFTKKDGLFHNGILHILEDKKANLWMSHVRGISRVSKQDLYRFGQGSSDHFETAVFGKDDGLRNNGCVGGNQSPACKTPDGKMWFSTVEGAAFIDPGNIFINTQVPPVHIDKVLLDDDAFPPGGQVAVQPGVKRLEVQYTALSFINPKAIKFKYRLEGYDEEWIAAGSDRKALYTNLDPGDYRFNVAAANNDGIWNETGAFVGIKVIPHYSKTWWFQVLALIVFAVLSYLVIHFTRNYFTLTAFWKKQKYIGNYKLLDIIGSGGMGTIYKAQSLLEKNKVVALKVLREEMFTDENSRKRFRQEAAIIDQLDHPNIVKVVERGEAKQNLFIAMEYLKGITLTRKINEQKKMEIKNALHIMIQIADALAKIHSKNIIHRDLKPDNVMLLEREGDPNFVKLLDFGLARTQYQSRLTQTGVVIGTINYLAPEQVSGKNSNASGDIYSLGVLFYEILVGEKPFIGETTIDIMKQIMDKTPIEPIRFREDVPLELNHLIMKMLEKDRKSRPIIYDVVTHLKTIAYTLNS